MEVGSLVKYYRIKNGKTQVELCTGICTPSYLSRIENNQIYADEEIYTLLFNKLGISYERILKENNKADKRLEKWYKDMFFLGKSSEDVEHLKRISATSTPSIYLKFQIMYIRYLLLNLKIELAEEKISLIKNAINNKEKTSKRNYFLFINMRVSLLFLRKRYEDAVNISLEASNQESFLSGGYDYEIGAFYYNLGLNYRHLYNYEQSKYFTTKALKIFNNNYYLKQAIDCLILLGISYNNLGMSDNSLQKYNKAINLLKYLPTDYHKEYLGRINHNIGFSFQKHGNYTKAVDYYLKSLPFRIADNKLLTLINLAFCYYSLENTDKARKLLAEVEKYDRTSIEKTFKVKIEILNILLSNKSLTSKNINHLEGAFKYFVENNQWNNVAFYGELIAYLLEREHHYKKANKIYKTLFLFNKNNLYNNKGGNIQ